MTQEVASGALALVGSGEYTPAMNATDARLLATVGGPAAARVAVIPTASGMEAGSPERWNRQGVAHFTALGALTIAVPLIDRAGASDPAIVDQLAGSNVFYFSGGNPGYLIETLRDTPAWATIESAWHDGAVIAGCSAGAMMMSAWVGGLRQVISGGRLQWSPGIGVAEGIIVLPHFDRFLGRISLVQLTGWAEHSPDGSVIVGVDEDTALVRDGSARPWQVSGRQQVTVFRAGRPPASYADGETVPV